MKREGIILIISAPSGAGKTTLCRALMERFPSMKESVSYTTRAPRAGEVPGVDLVMDIDCQGARRLKEQIERCIYVFILPPSMEELRRRLENRSSDLQQVIDLRIERAAGEIREARWYDYIIINDNFETAFAELSAIVVAQSRRTFRMLGQVAKLFDI